MAPSSKTIFPILLVNFIGTMGYSIVLPFLIVIVLKFGGNELIYGVLGATYSFFQLIGAPILGRWSDRIGRRKVLLLSQVGTFLAWILFLFALLLPRHILAQVDHTVVGAFVLSLPLVVLFFARALDGITGGNVSVANAYLADISTDENRKQHFGKMAAAANMGFIIGPAIAGILGATLLGDLLPVLLAMAISLLAIAVIAFRLEESNPCVLSKTADSSQNRKIFGQEHKECHDLEGAEKANLSTILALPFIPLLLTLYFLVFLAFNFFYVSFPVYAIQDLGWSMVYLGFFYSMLGGVMILFQGPVLGYLSRHFSDRFLILVGAISLAIGFPLFLQTHLALIGLGVLFFAAGNGIMWPSFLAVLSRAGGTQYQGAVQGYASSAGSLASIIGLITGGIVFSHMGNYIFLIPALLMVLIAISSLQLWNGTKQGKLIS